MIINIRHIVNTGNEREVLHQQVNCRTLNEAECLAIEYRNALRGELRSNYVERQLFTEQGQYINR